MPEKEDKEKQTLLELTRQVVKQYPKLTNYAYWTFDGKENIQGAACHATFKEIMIPKKFQYYGTIYSPDEEFHKYFWPWVIDQEKSPWRIITSQVELVTNENDEPRGWIIHRDAFEEIHFNFIRNFSIATRSVSEYEEFRKNFIELCKRGLDPRDAYILGKSIGFLREGIYTEILLTRHTGGHWPVTYPAKWLHQSIQFDWNKWWYGNVSRNFDWEATNSFFMKKSTSNSVDSIKPTSGGEKIGGKFSAIMGYSLEVLIETYLDWKKKNGYPSEN